MSPKQENFYWGLWGKVCVERGWDRLPGKEREVKRKEVMAQIFGEPKSMRTLSNGEFDRVKVAFQALANGQDLVQAVHELDHPEDGDRRRIVWKIEHVVIPCLGVYVERPEAYLAEVLRDRFKVFSGLSHWSLLPHERTVKEDEDGRLVSWPNALRMFLMTATRLADDLRQKAGHSVHEMKTAAGVQCACKACATGVKVVVDGRSNGVPDGALTVQTVAKSVD